MEKKISGYTEYENENEVILRSGSQFRVQSDALEQSNGSYLVHLVEGDDNDEDEPIASAMNNMSVTPKPSNEGASSKSFQLFFLIKLKIFERFLFDPYINENSVTS